MNVYGLVGNSGTGKSYIAIKLSKKYKINYIIDDGLLIYKHRILAGKTAKKEKTKIASIKTALFTDDEHLREVRKVIKESKISNLLVLGTSVKMIEKICHVLSLPKTINFIRIEQISGSKDIKKAKEMRKKGGHVIPAPLFEVRKHFLGHFLDIFKKSEEKFRTIIRPGFIFEGQCFISNRVIRDICTYEILKNKKILKINSIKILKSKKENFQIYLNLSFSAKSHIKDSCMKISKIIKNNVEFITNQKVEKIKILVSSMK